MVAKIDVNSVVIILYFEIVPLPLLAQYKLLDESIANPIGELKFTITFFITLPLGVNCVTQLLPILAQYKLPNVSNANPWAFITLTANVVRVPFGVILQILLPDWVEQYKLPDVSYTAQVGAFNDTEVINVDKTVPPEVIFEIVLLL